MMQISVHGGESSVNVAAYHHDTQSEGECLRGQGWATLYFGHDHFSIHYQTPESLESLGRKLIEAGERLRRQLAEQTSPAPDALVTA